LEKWEETVPIKLYSPPEAGFVLKHCEEKLSLDSPHLTEALNFEHSNPWET